MHPCFAQARGLLSLLLPTLLFFWTQTLVLPNYISAVLAFSGPMASIPALEPSCSQVKVILSGRPLEGVGGVVGELLRSC